MENYLLHIPLVLFVLFDARYFYFKTRIYPPISIYVYLNVKALRILCSHRIFSVAMMEEASHPKSGAKGPIHK